VVVRAIYGTDGPVDGPTPWRAGSTREPQHVGATIRILLVDDHTLLRQGLASLLRGTAGMQVVGEAGNGRDAVTLAERLRPDVILMDIAMPLVNGVEATREIARRFPGIRVLVLGTPSYADQVVPILRAGAAGYLLKDSEAEELYRAIQAVHQGNCYFSPAVSGRLVDRLVSNRPPGRNCEQPLSAREREILDLVVDGFTNQEIAQRSCLSVKTVEAHKSHIIAKLGLRSTLELIKYGVRRQMLELDA
jgi:two-component system, NarL family, response regulator NreC